MKVDFSRMPGWLAAVQDAVDEGLTAAARTHSNFVRGSFSKLPRYASSAPGMPPNERQGYLKGALAISPGRAGRASSGVRMGIPYARILELGGVIRARGRMLPVPLNDQAARIGEKANGLRNVPGLFTFRSKRGNIILMGKDKRRVTTYKGGAAIRSNAAPMWVLKKSVRILPRPYLLPALNNNRTAIHGAAVETARRQLRRYATRATGGRL